MKKLADARPNAALAVSIVALVVASGGTAVAAGGYLISSSRQIKPGTIVASNVHRHSLSASNLSSAAVAELRGRVTVRTASANIPVLQDVDVRAGCQPGERAVSGGYGDDGPAILATRPDPSTGTPTGWVVTASNTSLPPAPASQTVYVVCVS